MFLDEKEYSKLLRRERAPLNMYFHIGGWISLGLSVLKLSQCVREERQDFVNHS